MAFLINIKTFWLIGLLIMSTTIHANSKHNYFVMTLSILSYTKWKSNNSSLCVIPTNSHTVQNFQESLKFQNLSLVIKTISEQSLSTTHCDIAYFTQLTPEQEQKLIQQSLNKNILTFSTNNTECEIGSVFCLYTSKTGNTQFRVNLDSLSNSKIHIDPRVLLLAKNSE